MLKYQNVKVSKKKEKLYNLKFLKDKNFMYYSYWYLFYSEKINKTKNYYEIIELFNIKEINKNRIIAISESIKTYFHFQPFLKKNSKSNLFNNKYSNLMLYYVFNAGFNKSTLMEKNFIEFENYDIMMIDIRFSKARIFGIDNSKCILTLTTGIITKLLNIKEKNLKRSGRTLNVLLKTAIKRISLKTNKSKIIVYIKGSKFYLNNLINILNTNYNENDLIIMFNPSIRRNKIKFKKIRSIKRNLLKNFIKSESFKN